MVEKNPNVVEMEYAVRGVKNLLTSKDDEHENAKTKPADPPPDGATNKIGVVDQQACEENPSTPTKREETEEEEH